MSSAGSTAAQPSLDRQTSEKIDRIVDVGLRYNWASQRELFPYLSTGWQDYVGDPTDLVGVGEIPVLPRFPYRSYRGDAAPGLSPAEATAELTADFDKARSAQGLLIPDRAMTLVSMPNFQLSQALIRAHNDWTIEQWLEPEPRLLGTILVPSQLPVVAAEEIRRVGSHPQIKAVLLGDNGLGKPFGHPAYRPILEAADEMSLTLVLSDGTDTTPDNLTQPTGGGMPATYAEFRSLSFQAVMTNVVSLIGQGVFEQLPRLRVLTVGGGITWAPGLLWRLDNEFRALRREAPWLQRLPSEYFADHVRISTYPLEKTPSREVIESYVSLIPGGREVICYGSGKPAADADDVDLVLQSLGGDTDGFAWRNAAALLESEA